MLFEKIDYLCENYLTVMLVKISGIFKKMNPQPTKGKVFNFFYGIPNQLTKKEIIDIKKIVEKEHKELINFLSDKIKSVDKCV